MTLFDAEPVPIRRRSAPLAGGDDKPKWSKYTAQKPQRCDECVEVAYESLPGPFPGIAQARWSRRQGGQTRLYCSAHKAEQHAEDQQKYGLRAAS